MIQERPCGLLSLASVPHGAVTESAILSEVRVMLRMLSFMN
jgi:hypothetical protein